MQTEVKFLLISEKDSVSSGVKTARVNYVLTAGMRQPTDYYKVFINCDG